MDTLSARNGGFILCLLAILAYGVSISLYMIKHLDLFSIISMFADDAFYYFQIARNFADGQFSTFDGGITRTNGYHPLWMFLIIPLWWLFDSESVLFAIQVFQIMLTAGAIVLIVIAARLANVYWLLLFGVLPVLYHTSGSFLGLEVSAGLFMLGMLFLALGLYIRDPVRWRWFLAIVAFLLPWARLEYMAISLSVTAILCFIEYSRAHKFWISFTPLFGAGAGCLIYFAYNRIVFGGYVPVSGPTKQLFSQARFERFADTNGEYNFLQNFQDMANTVYFDWELLVAFEVCIYFLLVWWFCLRNQKKEDWLFLSFMIGMLGLALGHIAKFGQNVIMMHPEVIKASYWYYAPGFLMMELIIPVRCYVAIYFINKLMDGNYPRIAGILRKSVFLVTVLFISMNTNVIAPYQHVEHYLKPQSPTWVDSSYAGALLMNRILPDGSIIGSWDSGATGYFSRFPVVNLDGLANSYEYMRMQRRIIWDIFSESELDSHNRMFGITHFGNQIHDSLFWEGKEFLADRYFETYPAIDNTFIFVIWPSRQIENDLETMKRQFDFETNGIGVIVDGRLIQIFSDCEIAKDRSSLVVLFDGENNVSGIANPWNNRWTMKRGKAPGSCLDFIRLPKDAAAPVRMEILSEDEAVSRLIENGRMIISSDYDVYLHKHKVLYVNDQCDPGMSPSFFTEFTPLDDFDLLIGDRRKGFNSYVFDFDNYARRIGNDCIAILPLPEYGIAKIRTGQFTDKALLWDAVFRFDMITDKAG